MLFIFLIDSAPRRVYSLKIGGGDRGLKGTGLELNIFLFNNITAAKKKNLADIEVIQVGKVQDVLRNMFG